MSSIFTSRYHCFYGFEIFMAKNEIFYFVSVCLTKCFKNNDLLSIAENISIFISTWLWHERLYINRKKYWSGGGYTRVISVWNNLSTCDLEKNSYFTSYHHILVDKRFHCLNKKKFCRLFEKMHWFFKNSFDSMNSAQLIKCLYF